MHIEKIIFDNIFYTILNVKGRTKDTVKAHLDLEDIRIRKKLHLIWQRDRLVKLLACYVLNWRKRNQFLAYLRSTRFFDGYASNLKWCIKSKDGKIVEMKSHDCHVLLQYVLPVGLRGLLPDNLCDALFNLKTYFSDLYAKMLRRSQIDILEKKIIITLCKLEMIFPPSFFDIMVHLLVHLSHEARLDRLVHTRWMYPIER